MLGRSRPEISLDEIDIFYVGGRETELLGLDGKRYPLVLAVRKNTGKVIITRITWNHLDLIGRIPEKNVYSRGSSRFADIYETFVEHDRLPENPEHLKVPKLSRQNE